MPARKNIPAGTRFGKLTATGNREQRKGLSYFECLCECGSLTFIRGDRFTERDQIRRCAILSNHHPENFDHGLSRSPEYRARIAMLNRCSDKTRKSHGGRGITVCQEWRESFEAFYRDMGPRPSPRHSVDRINNDGNYEPDNCRWATGKEQMRNTRYTRLITFNSETLCASDWASRIGITPETLTRRIKRWGTEKALTTAKIAENDHGEHRR